MLAITIQSKYTGADPNPRGAPRGAKGGAKGGPDPTPRTPQGSPQGKAEGAKGKPEGGKQGAPKGTPTRGRGTRTKQKHKVKNSIVGEALSRPFNIA